MSIVITKAPKGVMDLLKAPRIHPDFGPWQKQGVGRRGTFERRILRERIISMPDGRTYREYLHATKGFRLRRVTRGHKQ